MHLLPPHWYLNSWCSRRATNSHIVKSLQSHLVLTMSHCSNGLTVCFPSQGTWVQNPRGVLKWNGDSPVSIVPLHWWCRCDWSCLRPAKSRIITRPSCQQCDNPIWSRTALLSRFYACCRSPLQLHNWPTDGVGCWGELYGEPAISLNSHHVSLVQWTTRLLPVTRDPGSKPQGGT
jgi:hypothetical protein